MFRVDGKPSNGTADRLVCIPKAEPEPALAACNGEEATSAAETRKSLGNARISAVNMTTLLQRLERRLRFDCQLRGIRNPAWVRCPRYRILHPHPTTRT